MRMVQFLAAAIGLVALVGAATAAEPDDQDSRLEKVLRRFPDADTNKDGKLSPEEAHAYTAKIRSKQAATPNEPSTFATAPASPQAGRRARRASDAPPPDHADVSYGSHPNNHLDLWLAKSDRPTPLVVFIHGGGFKAGDKSSASGAAIKQCLDAGVSFASINYRFRTEASINVVLRDCARAIQFLRFKAGDYNLDKSHVAAFGGSAGAGASLWLAFRDDLADPKSDDPVLRESSRLTAAASSAGQATYDILQWRDVLGSDEAMRFYPESEWPAFYGLKTRADLDSEEGKKLRADVDMLGLISKDDPPIFLGAGEGHDDLANKGDTNHSPKHSEAVKRQCDEIGVTAVLKIGSLARGEVSGGSPVTFLLKYVAEKNEKESP